MKKEYQVARLLAYVTGLVNQDLLLQGRISCGENRILGTCRHDCEVRSGTVNGGRVRQRASQMVIEGRHRRAGCIRLRLLGLTTV